MYDGLKFKGFMFWEVSIVFKTINAMLHVFMTLFR